MEESVREQLIQIDDPHAREQLVRLHDVLKSASTVRARLQLEVTGAGDKFMDAQVGAFRARRPSALPDFESTLLPAAMACAMTDLLSQAESLMLSLYPAVVPKTPDLSDLLALLQERRGSDEALEDEDDDGEVQPFRVYPLPFPETLTEFVRGWLERKFLMGGRWRLDELLSLAEDEGLSAIERQGIAYALYRSFPDSENLFPTMHCSADGVFTADVASGDNLRFDARRVANDSTT